MSVLVNNETRLIVQGFTGREGTFHASQAIAYGTKGGRRRGRPGKGGTTHLDLPVFDTVAQAVKATGATASVIFVPPPFAADAIMEAADAGLPLVVCITEGIPALDMVKAWGVFERQEYPPHRPQLSRHHFSRTMQDRHHAPATFICRATRRVSSPAPARCHLMKRVGQLTGLGIGQSTCIGIGGDPIIGTTFLDAIQLFNEDPDTHAIVMIGEIGGNAEDDRRGLHRRAREKAGGWLHRRTIRASRSPHGPRRSYHFRRLGSGPGQDAGHGSRRYQGVRHSRRNRWRQNQGASLTSEYMSNLQRTFSIIKPDAVADGNAGNILSHLEKEGFRPVGLRMLQLSQREAEGFYAVHRERPFFSGLVKFMTEGPVIVMAPRARGRREEVARGDGRDQSRQRRRGHDPQTLRLQHRAQLHPRLRRPRNRRRRVGLLLPHDGPARSAPAPIGVCNPTGAQVPTGCLPPQSAVHSARAQIYRSVILVKL